MSFKSNRVITRTMPAHPILIAGPTASGKSRAALDLAVRLNGVVINADAMQMYADLRILTARPSPEDEAAAPHRLYGVLDAAETGSVGLWLRHAAAALEEAARERWRPIFVGGTGLYFVALTEGLAPVPDIPAETRAAAHDAWAALGPERFHAQLSRRDPTAAALSPNDRQRLIRAWSVLEATGRTLADWQTERTAPLVSAGHRFVTSPERVGLYARCDARFERMLQAGAWAEVEALASRGLDPGLPAMKALGVPQLMAALRGEMSKNEAVTAAKTATRHYVKRQITWFRNQMMSWNHINAQDSKSLSERIFTFICENT